MSQSPTAPVSIAGQIERFVRDDLLAGTGGEFTRADALLELGIVDSLGLLDVVMFLETEFDLTIDESSMTIENFGSIDDIAEFVAAQLAATDS